MKSISHWLNGSVTLDKSARTGEIYNPATGEVSGNVAFADLETVNKVVDISEKAFEQWRHASLTKKNSNFVCI